MMKILTQKMRGAQGLAANPLVMSSEARNLLSAGAGKQQIPRRIRSSE
jgi:hypothetical protein